MTSSLKRILGLPLLIGFWNCLLILFAPAVFWNILTLIPLLCFNAFLCIDIIIRPISTKQDQYPRPVLILSFLAVPLMLALPHFEAAWWSSLFLSSIITLWMAFLGFLLLFTGGAIALASRIQLGKFGGPKIVIEDHHQLIITGMYRYIRHPQYLGFLLLFLGYLISTGSIIFTLIIPSALFLIFRNRMIYEENLLTKTFGESYISYKQRTKRLIPFVY